MSLKRLMDNMFNLRLKLVESCRLLMKKLLSGAVSKAMVSVGFSKLKVLEPKAVWWG